MRKRQRLPIPNIFMKNNSLANLETSVSSIRIEFESTEVREAIRNRSSTEILNIGGIAGISGSIDRTRNNCQTATSSVIDAIRFDPSFESQSTAVTGDSEFDL